MRCKSCKEDVPPKFVHAMSVNICPLCGNEIMDIKLQSILNELKAAMDNAKEYSEQVEDWLASNYSLKKFNPNDHTKMPQHNVPVKINRNDDLAGEDEVVLDNQPLPTSSVFAERAGVNRIKRVVDHIKGNMGAADPAEFQGIDEEYGNIADENEFQAMPLDSNAHQEIQGIFREQDINKVSQDLELQRLKKMRAQSTINNGGGSFRRG